MSVNEDVKPVSMFGQEIPHGFCVRFYDADFPFVHHDPHEVLTIHWPRVLRRFSTMDDATVAINKHAESFDTLDDRPRAMAKPDDQDPFRFWLWYEEYGKDTHERVTGYYRVFKFDDLEILFKVFEGCYRNLSESEKFKSIRALADEYEKTLSA